VSPPQRGRLAGTVRWAVVPYAPKPPFRLYAGADHPPIVVPDVEQLVESGKRHGDAEFTYLVTGKARPILVLSEPTSSLHDEVTGLRLLRLSKLSDEDQRLRVRSQQEPLLFHLDPARFDLPEENAAMVSALVRVHVDALDSRASLGELNENEHRVLGERMIDFYGFDTRLLVERRIHELAARRRARDEG
jgi:hypothetical protein